MGRPVRHLLGVGLAVAVGCTPTSHVNTHLSAPQDERPAAAVWEALPAEPHQGKQDDVTFVDANLGFYVNGLGRIFRTADGGRSWERVRDTPGTYFRAIGMLDARTGFAGNIGTDYFPGVTDTNPLYRTSYDQQAMQSGKPSKNEEELRFAANGYTGLQNW